MNIEITGASGAGKTYLGKALAEKLNCNFVDTDDILWVWDENVQPYTIAVDEKIACQKLKEELENHKNTVASGMFYPWSEDLISYFRLLIVLDTNKEIRRKRIIKREEEMYGERFKKNGDMYDQFTNYLNWSMNYDTSSDELGSKFATDKWERKFSCDVLHIDGSLDLEEKIKIILNKINEIIEQ